MVKKHKVSTKAEKHDLEDETSEDTMKSLLNEEDKSIVKRKKRVHKVETEDNKAADVKPKTKKKKRKIIKAESANDGTTKTKRDIIVGSEPLAICINSVNNNNAENTTKPLFVDNKARETHIGINKIETNKKKKFLNDDEAEVKEEDIDKFCQDLDEEENKKFLEWVKLIEAKLHSNSNSNKQEETNK